jgi:hypothetical protein
MAHSRPSFAAQSLRPAGQLSTIKHRNRGGEGCSGCVLPALAAYYQPATNTVGTEQAMLPF